MVDPDRNPFQYFIVESGLTDEQVKQICALMEETYTALVKRKAPTDAYEFEKQMMVHLPEKQKMGGVAYNFMKGLLITFDQTGQWPEVVEHYRRDFNVPVRD